MASLVPGYEYDIFISYRQKDNKHDGWVSDFVDNLKGELESTFKEDISVYFDINPHDGLLETHDVDASLKEKLKCAVFIPIISRTYCDPKSFAWEHEFKAFIEHASKDQYGLKVKLPNSNVASRVLPVCIHELESNDIKLCESVLGGVLRGVEFIFKSPGVNRPLLQKEENPQENQNRTSYRDQINKVANAVQEIISGMMSAESSEQQDLPESGSEQQEKEEEEAVTGRKKRRTGIIVGLILILFIGALFVFQLLGKKNSTAEQLEKSIAVLPFKNDSPQASEENTPFVNGLMEEILINLQTIKEFRVPGRTSVEQFRDNTSKTIPEIARELDVNYIVEGSVQKYGDRFRLRVQLIRAKGKEAHLWAKSYEQAITGTDDIFKIQSEIAQAIATELKIVISPDEKQLIEQSPTENLDAYYTYQRGKEYFMKYLLNNKDKESLTRAENYFHQALKDDSAYAQAFTGLAMVFWEKHFKEDYYAFSKSFMDSVIILSNIALSYDKNLAEAYSLRGDVYRVNGKYDEAINEYNNAIKLNPSYWQAYVGLALLYQNQKRDFIQTLENLFAALKLNHEPILRPTIIWNIGYVLNHLGFFPESMRYYNESLKLTGDSAGYYSQLGGSKSRQEKYPEAIKLFEESQKLDPGRNRYGVIGDCYLKMHLKDSAFDNYKKYIAKLDTAVAITAGVMDRHRVGYRYLMTGQTKEAEKFIDLQKQYCEESIELNREYGQNALAYYDLAGIYAIKGDKENAYRNLHLYNEKIGDTEMRTMVYFFKTDPFFDSIRDEPEFQAIYREIETKYNNTHELVRKWLKEHGKL